MAAAIPAAPIANGGFIFLSSQSQAFPAADRSDEWNAGAGPSTSRHVIAPAKSAQASRGKAKESERDGDGREDYSFNDSRNSDSTSPRSFLPPLTPSRYQPPIPPSPPSPPSPDSPNKAPRTPRRRPGSILRPHHTPGTGSSVRFGKRLYDDGAESSVSTIFESPGAETSSVSAYTVGGRGNAGKGTLGRQEEEEEDGTTEELFLPTPPVLRGVSDSAKEGHEEDSFEDAGQIEEMLSPTKRPVSHPPNPFLRANNPTRGSKGAPSLQEANQRALSSRKRSPRPQHDRADISAADSSSSSSSGSTSADFSGGNGKHGATDSSPTIRVGAGAGGMLRGKSRSPFASHSAEVQGRKEESELQSLAVREMLEREGEEEEKEVPRGGLPREDSVASLQLADLPSLDNMSSLFETNAAALRPDEPASGAPSPSSTVQHSRSSSSPSANEQNTRRQSSSYGFFSSTAGGNMSTSTSADQSISMSVGMLEREATGFRQRWEAEEEKEKSRRVSMGVVRGVSSELVEEQLEGGHRVAEVDPVTTEQENSSSASADADRSSSFSPASVPLPASPAPANNTNLPRVNSPLAAEEEDTSTDSTDSQPLPSPGPSNASPSSVFMRGRALLQRHSTPPVSSAPSSPAHTPSPSAARQARRAPVLPGDLRKQIARKNLPGGVKGGTSFNSSKDLLPPTSHRVSSPLSRSSPGNGSFTSFASNSLASASASAAHRSSLFFDVAEDNANLSAVFETARELDEVHSERTAHLIERLQQGDHEIVSLRQTLQQVASSELDALEEIDLLRQRAENAELALLREKEEAFAAARLQDQQHSEVAALIERLKAEVAQQQSDIEGRAQVQQEAFTQQEELIGMLQEELEEERQGREQDQRDFEVRLLAAREEECAAFERRLEEEKEAARQLAVDACERDFAIRQARDAEDVKFNIYQLEDKLGSTEEQLSEARSREEALQGRLHELEQELAEAHEDLERETSRNRDHTAQSVDEAAAERERADALEQENVDLQALVARLRAAEEGAVKAQKETAAEQDSLTSKLATAEARISELEALAAELEGQPMGSRPTSATHDDVGKSEDALAEELSQTRMRISKLERMNASSGIEIAKLQKRKEQLERDNRNYGIALSAKQSELSMLKRNGGIRYAMALTPRESAVPDTVRRLGLMPPSLYLTNAAHGNQHQPADSEMTASPSQHKAARLKGKKGAESREGLLSALKVPSHAVKEKENVGQILQENNWSVQHSTASRKLRTPIHAD